MKHSSSFGLPRGVEGEWVAYCRLPTHASQKKFNDDSKVSLVVRAAIPTLRIASSYSLSEQTNLVVLLIFIMIILLVELEAHSVACMTIRPACTSF